MKYRISVDGQTFEVEVGDLNSRPIIAKIDDETFEIWPEESALSTPTAPPRTSVAVAPPPTRTADKNAGAASPNGRLVYAPIPGVIDAVNVTVGETVSAGQQLCVLEAMKMKNIIRSTRVGTIATIHVQSGQQVKHHDPLIEFA